MLEIHSCRGCGEFFCYYDPSLYGFLPAYCPYCAEGREHRCDCGEHLTWDPDGGEWWFCEYHQDPDSIGRLGPVFLEEFIRWSEGTRIHPLEALWFLMGGEGVEFYSDRPYSPSVADWIEGWIGERAASPEESDLVRARVRAYLWDAFNNGWDPEPPSGVCPVRRREFQAQAPANSDADREFYRLGL